MRVFTISHKLNFWDDEINSTIVELIKEAGYDTVEYQGIKCKPDELLTLIDHLNEQKNKDFEQWLEEAHAAYINAVADSGLPVWIIDMYNKNSIYNIKGENDILPF